MNGEINQKFNAITPDLIFKSLTMKSNPNSNQEQQTQQFSNPGQQNVQQSHQSTHLEQQHHQNSSIINPLGSIPLPMMTQIHNNSSIQSQLLQAAQILNRNQLQQLFQQQQQKQLQHQLIEEKLIQQSQQHPQQNINTEFLIQAKQNSIASNSHSTQPSSLYSNNLQNIQNQQQVQNMQNSISNDETTILNSYNYMPGTASLIEYIDKQLMVMLRDGKKLIGYLRSIDQYANLLLSNTFERIYVNNKYADIQRGIYMVRGENVVLIGEVDLSMPLKVNVEQVSEKEILELQSKELKKQEEADKAKKKALLERCLIPNTDTIFDEYY